MPNYALGIMTCRSKGRFPFTEVAYYRQLCLLGIHLNLQVFVFSPERIDWILKRVIGYTYSQERKRWLQGTYSLPYLVYDRCFYKSRNDVLLLRPHIQRLRQMKSVYFLGNPIKGKWNIQKILMQDPYLHPYLPNTRSYDSHKFLIQWLRQKKQAFLKAQSGSQGRGVLHIMHVSSHHYSVRGRTWNNQSFHIEFTRLFDLLQWLRRFIQRRKYIIQDYLSVTSKSGQAFDIRSLMQKNGQGVWQMTGAALRCGQPGSITSNLHGGGHAEDALPFLTKEFGARHAQQTMDTVKQLSEHIPSLLEQQYGQLVELGIDFGIDQKGNIWILEINSKPGRAAFKKTHRTNSKKSSIQNPIHYARYILDRQLGG